MNLTKEQLVLARVVYAMHCAEHHVATFHVGARYVTINCNAEPCKTFAKAVR